MVLSRNVLLYGGLALTGILFAGDAGLRRFVTEPLDKAERNQTVLRKNINTRQVQLRKATQSLDVLAQLEKRSLPRNGELARSRYQQWLLALIEDAGLKGPNVDSSEAQDHKGLYKIFTFSVNGRGTLSQVTDFLHVFYSAGHLHKIRSMTLNPLQGGEQIDLTLSIEALSLPGASRSDELTTADSDALALASLSDYQSLVRRNLFRAGDVDRTARSTVLTAITSDVRGTREAWFRVGKSGPTRVLREGDALSIDTFSAEVVEIADDHVVVRWQDEPRTLSVGKSVAEAPAAPKATL